MHRTLIPQRQPVFFGCEGESERSYGTFLNQLFKVRCPDIHLDVLLLRPGGGDPLELAKRACKRIHQREMTRDVSYLFRVILLDSDRLGQDERRDTKFQELISKFKIHVIWQQPCHEAFLLQHLDSIRQRPQTCADADRLLRKIWNTYEKGQSAMRLRDKITEEYILRAASANKEFAEFLGMVKYSGRG